MISINQNDTKFYIELLQQKIMEFDNLVENIKQILLMEEPLKLFPEKTEGEEIKIAECKKKVEKYIRKIDKREKGITFQLMHETWLAKNNSTGELEPITHEYFGRLKMGSFERKIDRYGANDPDEKVKAELYRYVLKIFGWFFKEKKQHRIDINFPYRGGCAIAVR